MDKTINGEIIDGLLYIENNRLYKLSKFSKDQLLHEYEMYCTQQANVRTKDEFDQLESNKMDVIYFLQLIDLELKDRNIVLIIKKEYNG